MTNKVGKNRKGRFQIPAIVQDHMAGCEIYPDSDWFHRNPESIQKRAVEDAEFLVSINLDGYEDYGDRGLAACKKFIARSKAVAK